jgi:hypothetical protein
MASLKFGAWLRRVERSPYADRLVLRGSLVTRRFFPSRKCEDVDHLLLDGTADELQRAADAVIAVPDEEPLEIVAREKLWPEMELPGHRVVFANGLQVDIGFGDPITAPPERVAVEGANVLCVRPESMIAWKMHGLVELGERGRWRPKDLHDLFLYASLAVDEAEVKKALPVAFSSRGHSPSLLAALMNEPTWGTSRGSRNRWKRFRRDEVPTAPDLPDVIAKVRARFRSIVLEAELDDFVRRIGSTLWNESWTFDPEAMAARGRAFEPFTLELATFRSRAPDPLLARGALRAIGNSDADNWYRGDQVGHIVPQEKKTDEPSFADHAFALIEANADRDTPDALEKLAERLLVEAACNEAQMASDLKELAAAIRSRLRAGAETRP